MTLPFISYGGSSIISLAYGVGMMLALTRQRPRTEVESMNAAGVSRGYGLMVSLLLELVLIRWLASVFPVFSFYKNFTLLACFLGLGAGYAVAEKAAVCAGIGPADAGNIHRHHNSAALRYRHALLFVLYPSDA